MADPFKKVVFLADEFSRELAGDTYTALTKYNDLKHKRIPGGIRPFYQEDLRIAEQRNFEFTPEVLTTVRGRHVYVFVSPVVKEGTNIRYDPNTPIIRAALISDACREAGADRVNLVMPHLPYLRQDRRTNYKTTGAERREPISARVILDILQASGYSGLITVDPHFQQFRGFVPKEMYGESPTARVALTSYIQRKFNPQGDKRIGVVSPDFGGGERAEIAAKDMNATFLALSRKRRIKAGAIGDMTVYLEEGTSPNEIDIAVIYDDIADSCGTMIKCAEAISKLGIEKIIGVATHPVFSDGAIKKLQDAKLEMVVSNTIPLLGKHKGIHVVDISTILGVTIHCIATGHGSLSNDIFDSQRYQDLERRLSS
ncbi:MAG: ribose-phosphate diphosphokinase [bacterium]|nr:ribose-phosphate diphosphokinase [bacterium]